MSWLARSIVNSLAPDHGDDSDGSEDSAGETSKTGIGGEDQARGVKEDISELTQTLTRQLWGVASFLAPPPTQTLAPSSSPNSPDDPAAAEGGESPRIAGIRNDLAEIGGRFRSGISMLSSHKAVSEISKIASTLFAPDEWEEEGEEGSFVAAVGITDDVLAFVQNVSMHPETWLDFPLLLDDDDYDDFNMSDAQQEHALAVERHVPRLTALRIELCPSHMSEGCFWKVYFVLLHPRLNKYDAELLSTPQIVQARAMLQDLQNRTRPGSESSEKDVSTLTVTPGERESITSPAFSQKDVSTLIVTPGETIASPANIVKTTAVDTHTSEESTLSVLLTELITEKHPIQSTEIKVIDKSVIEEEPLVQQDETKNYPSKTSKISIQSDEEDADEWLEEETGEVGVSGGSIPFGNDEDVSFSDLEEEDDHASSKSKTCNVASAEKEDSGWVQLNKNTGDSANSHTKGSNDWLDLDLDAA